MARSHAQRHRHDQVGLLCKLAGAPDVETYLGIPPGSSTKDALVLLERKRRELERLLADPHRAREAEAFLDAYGAIREHLGRSAVELPRGDADAPDYYAALGVQADAPYLEIEQAWRRLRAAGRDVEPLVAQAWRVLGDPLNRAHYDRARRHAALPEDPPTDPSVPAEPRAAATAEIPGPEVRDLLIEGEAPLALTLPLVVRGEGRFRATLAVDHPCMSTQPEQLVDVGPGKHTLAVRVDPAKLKGRAATVMLTLSSPWEHHVVAFRLRRPGSAIRLGPWVLAGSAVLLVAVGWVLGTAITIQATTPAPASVGIVSQLPTASVCFSPAYAPLPAHLDVHIDGFGRIQGFSLGGPASPDLEECVREALVRLTFPPTPDGLPARHRYTIPARPTTTAELDGDPASSPLPPASPTGATSLPGSP